MSDYSKYNVPDFFVDTTFPTRYDWWSWHPLWKKWEKSCWGGSTEKEAFDAINFDIDILEAVGDSDAHKLDQYHNKLIKQNGKGEYEEVFDMPCKKTDLWDKCLDNKAKGFYRNNDIL
jgi:hypothetical protein